ncbi:MAG: permease [Nitrospinae bacterium]|nr:permease [Nitrospinota bacterium]MBF0635451.1 permease [Nitrospinota bacterium]
MRKRKVLIPTIMMAVIAVVLLYIGHRNGRGQEVEGLKLAFSMIVNVLPLLALVFIVAGMAQTMMPHEKVVALVGNESGLRGILIGAVAGGLTPGGPFVTMPLVAGFLGAGASVGTMVSFMTAWSLWAVQRLPMEMGILGWKFTVARLASTFIFPPIAGLIAQSFFSDFK